MNKQATTKQIEQMEEIYNYLNTFNYKSNDTKLAQMTHFSQIVIDIDAYSNFSKEIKEEVSKFKNNQYHSNNLIKNLMEQVIKYYK